jgi:hypothetical protein
VSGLDALLSRPRYEVFPAKGTEQAAGDGYLIEPGHPSEQFTGSSRIRQTPVVPAPASDTAPAVLWGITDPGAGESRVTWISVS